LAWTVINIKLKAKLRANSLPKLYFWQTLKLPNH